MLRFRGFNYARCSPANETCNVRLHLSFRQTRQRRECYTCTTTNRGRAVFQQRHTIRRASLDIFWPSYAFVGREIQGGFVFFPCLMSFFCSAGSAGSYHTFLLRVLRSLYSSSTARPLVQIHPPSLLRHKTTDPGGEEYCRRGHRRVLTITGQPR